jgi:hypothetical protein
MADKDGAIIVATPAPLTTEEKATKVLTATELSTWKAAEEKGYLPLAPSLSGQFFNLFMEGYSCADIAKRNHPFKESDVLNVRVKYNWDQEREDYAFQLQSAIKEKLIKTKLEGVQHLTNMLSAYHAEASEEIVRYLQTRKEEDKPDHWIRGPGNYKAVIELIEKLTGQDQKVQKHQIEQNTTVSVEFSGQDKELLQQLLNPTNAAKLLSATKKKV